MNADEHGWEKRRGRGRIVVAAVLLAAAMGWAGSRPWERPYGGEEATGPEVVALWQFEKRAETKDSSGKGHELKMRGRSRGVDGGRFGGGLECFAAPKDKPEGAQVAKLDPALSPKGAFTAELWMKPMPDMAKEGTAFLLDCKYYHYARDLPRANTGYVFLLQRTGTKWRPTAILGFGSASETYAAKPVELAAGTWYHLAFLYDGKGTGRILLDGKDMGGTTHGGRKDITPAMYPLTIGARYGSSHHGTPAIFDQVRISRGLAVRGIAIGVATAWKRTAFVRMEDADDIQVQVLNLTGKAVRDCKARVSFLGKEWLEHLGCAPPAYMSAFPRIKVPLDTSLRPGRYELKVTATAETADNEVYEAEEAVAVHIVPRPLPHRMPVVMWGGGDFETLKRIGFTHKLVHLSDYAKVWEEGKAPEGVYDGTPGPREEALNEHLVQGIGAVLTTAPGRFTGKKEGYQRLNRAGKPYERLDVCARHPKVREHGFNVGATVANLYGDFPAFQGALIHSEVRGHTNVCYHPVHADAYTKETARPMPREVVSKSIGHYSGLSGFPRDRVIPDGHPILAYYRWFWEKGDGWNGLHTEVHRGLKSTGRDDLWTFYDPAVRVPSKWGSGGGVDVISQWTYCYPDPIKIGQATDELFAMAEGRPGQQVMKMTQAIWYRNQTAPTLPEDPAKRAPWEKEIPDARFITIAPDHLREALWSKLSRPIRGIMYHGWGSLVKATHGSYRFTNPKTAEVLAQLTRDVVRPLGPTLLQVPDRKADVALLESFASQVFAGRGTWGWSHRWEADAHLVLQWAQLQPRIVYDETILRDGLDGYRVLVMPHCDVLTEGVAKRIAEFQRRGGIVVADEHLAPAIQPDILLLSRKRTNKADADKAALQKMAAQLRAELDTVYTRYGESDNPDVVVRFRRTGDTDYLFALNDTRTFGDYVGHHGRVMEKGLPTSATILIRRRRGHVYDLVRHEAVEAERCAEGLRLRLDFGPTEGRLLMITDRRLARLEVTCPRRAKLGESVDLRIGAVDVFRRRIGAVVPIQVEIVDPQGRPAERAGYYGAKDGQLNITLDIASNDLPGDWTIRVRELASGMRHERTLTVTR